MEYHRPYLQEKLQHEVSTGATTIGSQKERLRSQYSKRLNRLEKIQHAQSNINYLHHCTRVEISRLLTRLGLPASFKAPIFTVFKKILSQLKKGTKYRNPEKLLPTLLYFYCKKEGVAIDEVKLMDLSKIDKKDYNYCKLKISRLMPQYYERNRKDLIMNKILGLTEQYRLGMAFYYDTKKVLLRLWQGIKCTTDDVIAGLVSSIAVLCHYRDKVTISSICRTLNIQMSTIQSQVKRKLIEHFKVPGFESLVKSADLVKTIIYELGIFKNTEEKEVTPKTEEKECKVIEIEIVDGKQGASPPEEQFMFAIKSSNFVSSWVFVKIIRKPHKKEARKTRSRYQKELNFHKIIYHYPRGPPILSL